MFLISKTTTGTKKQKQKQNKKATTQKTKKPKEEKGLSVENLTEYDDNVSEFAQCTFDLLHRVVNFSWFFMYIKRNLVLVILQEHMKYTLSRTKIKENYFCLSFSLLYLFILSCKFDIIEACAYDITLDGNTMSSLIIQSI